MWPSPIYRDVSINLKELTQSFHSTNKNRKKLPLDLKADSKSFFLIWKPTHIPVLKNHPQEKGAGSLSLGMRLQLWSKQSSWTSPIWADSSHSWPREQSHHLGNLDLCQQAASAVCWGMGEEGGNVWAAGFYHKAFSLGKAYNEFPGHDTVFI